MKTKIQRKQELTNLQEEYKLLAGQCAGIHRLAFLVGTTIFDLIINKEHLDQVYARFPQIKQQEMNDLIEDIQNIVDRCKRLERIKNGS